jgi:hypothetical protein
LKFHLAPVRMAITKKKKKAMNAGEDAEKKKERL